MRPVVRRSRAWLGIVPFLVFVSLFLLLPVAFLVAGSLHDDAGELTLDKYAQLARPDIGRAFQSTIIVSAWSAVLGALFGTLLAWAAIMGPGRRLRGPIMTFAGVASNFAGVPLALAFIFAIGPVGMVTVWFNSTLGIRLPSLLSEAGLIVVYLYFQLPLMVLVVAPAIDGLRREWREAAESLGASSARYFRHIAIPILAPTILGATVLLFGNAFGAQATAYALTGGTIPILAVMIGAQISGDVLHDPGLGYAMAIGMVVVMLGAIGLYLVLQRRAERWTR